jgi:hypothetical protein
MDLFEYFEMKKREMINISELAKNIGCNRSYLSLVASRKTIPSYELCEAIEIHTKGVINAMDQFKNSRQVVRREKEKKMKLEGIPVQFKSSRRLGKTKSKHKEFSEASNQTAKTEN